MNLIDKREIARKFIHYTASLIPIIYYFLVEQKVALIILGICSAVIVSAELFRMINDTCYRLYMKIFGWMTRRHEHDRSFTGATYVFVGSFFTILLFPKEIAIISLLFLTVGDPTACLVGLSFGKIKILNKTLEGTLAFIIVGFLVTVWVPGISLPIKALGAIIASLVELIPWKLDDNITIPVVTGFFIWMIL